jgi:hypothetical protein
MRGGYRRPLLLVRLIDGKPILSLIGGVTQAICGNRIDELMSTLIGCGAEAMAFMSPNQAAVLIGAQTASVRLSDKGIKVDTPRVLRAQSTLTFAFANSSSKSAIPDVKKTKRCNTDHFARKSMTIVFPLPRDRLSSTTGDGTRVTKAGISIRRWNPADAATRAN